MIRRAPRLLRASQHCLRTPPAHRFISTAPPSQKSRSWKSLGARWGLALGVIYYYNTSNLFAEEPPFSAPPPQELRADALSPSPILESAATSRRQHYSTPVPPPPPSETPSPADVPATTVDGSMQETEDEAGQEGAFNPATGEINWDCPCLGGMAHGPCGEQFRAAFSCFVYSEQEPKGMDCIDKFKGMQDCFREHPDVYGSELEEDEVEDELAEGGGEVAVASDMPLEATSQKMEEGTGAASEAETGPSRVEEIASRAKAVTETVKDRLVGDSTSEEDALVPKAAHDATSANAGK